MNDVFSEIEQQEKKSKQNIKKVKEEVLRDEAGGEEWKKLEKSLYNQFYNNNKGKQHINLKHIDNLKIPDKKGKLINIEYDILIIIAAKNIGKSTGILYTAYNRHYENGEKIFFLRSSDAELEAATYEINESDTCPFRIIGTKNRKIIHKETGENWGLARNFKTCNSASGGEYKDYGAIMYDECCPWTSENRINDMHFFNWAALASSITRNKKKGIKIYCTGNLTPNRGLLDFYGINPEDKLRYIWRNNSSDKKNICKILYINADKIYLGDVSNQVGAVQGMSANFRHQLYENIAYLNGTLIINNSKIWKALDIVTSFILNNSKQEPYIFEVKKTPLDRQNKTKPAIYIVRVQRFVPYLITQGKIYTNCPITANTSEGITYLENIENKKYLIYDKAKSKKLRFYDLDSQIFCQSIIKTITPEKRAEHGF